MSIVQSLASSATYFLRIYLTNKHHSGNAAMRLLTCSKTHHLVLVPPRLLRLSSTFSKHYNQRRQPNSMSSSCQREAAQLLSLLPQRQMSHGAPPSTPDNPDSLQARQALDLFLLSASPEATAVVDSFLKTRVKGTLDEFLLNALHKGASGASGVGPFEVEWIAFATGAKNKFHSKSSENAWNQFEAFGGAEEAPALQLKVDERTVAEEVTVEGVALLRGVLRPSVASELRSFVLSDRDACVALALKDPKLNGEYFSRVLSPRDASPSSPTTRWDKRLPWSEEVESAVKEILGGSIGETVSELCGGDDALLWECSAFISAQGETTRTLCCCCLLLLLP